jgi:hypothetical protein
MAIGTMTLASKDAAAASAPVFVDRITLVGDSAYPTGGSTGVQAALRALTGDQRTILAVFSIALNGGYMPIWDADAGKLLLLNSGAGDAKSLPTEIDNDTDLHTTTLELLVISK